MPQAFPSIAGGLTKGLQLGQQIQQQKADAERQKRQEQRDTVERQMNELELNIKIANGISTIPTLERHKFIQASATSLKKAYPNDKDYHAFVDAWANSSTEAQLKYGKLVTNTNSALQEGDTGKAETYLHQLDAENTKYNLGLKTQIDSFKQKIAKEEEIRSIRKMLPPGGIARDIAGPGINLGSIGGGQPRQRPSLTDTGLGSLGRRQPTLSPGVSTAALEGQARPSFPSLTMPGRPTPQPLNAPSLTTPSRPDTVVPQIGRARPDVTRERFDIMARDIPTARKFIGAQQEAEFARPKTPAPPATIDAVIARRIFSGEMTLEEGMAKKKEMEKGTGRGGEGTALMKNVGFLIDMGIAGNEKEAFDLVKEVGTMSRQQFLLTIRQKIETDFMGDLRPKEEIDARLKEVADWYDENFGGGGVTGAIGDETAVDYLGKTKDR